MILVVRRTGEAKSLEGKTEMYKIYQVYASHKKVKARKYKKTLNCNILIVVIGGFIHK